MPLTIGWRHNRGTISLGLSINLKATHKQLAERAARFHGHRPQLCRPAEMNCPPTCKWQLVILSKEYVHRLLWITAWPLSVSPKNKPHTGPFLQSRDVLWLLECGKCRPIVCLCGRIEFRSLSAPRFILLAIWTSQLFPLMFYWWRCQMFTLCDDSKKVKLFALIICNFRILVFLRVLYYAVLVWLYKPKVIHQQILDSEMSLLIWFSRDHLKESLFASSM